MQIPPDATPVSSWGNPNHPSTQPKRKWTHYGVQVLEREERVFEAVAGSQVFEAVVFEVVVFETTAVFEVSSGRSTRRLRGVVGSQVGSLASTAAR